MSDHILMIASIVAALVAGRLCAWPTIARLRARLAHTNWALRRDPLTGLLNRTGLTEAHAARQQTQQYLTLVLVDLDGFKTVNDTHGHDVGDQLLIAAADRIHDAAAMYGGITARLAGDEFVVLLPIRNHDLDRPVELILTMLSAPATAHADHAPITLAVTASAGVCRAKPTDELDTLLRQADVAMYHAKHNGGAQHTLHHPGMAMPLPASRKGSRLRDRRREVNP